MPELPEVETVMRGLRPHLEGRRLARVEMRRPDLRWPMPPDLVQVLTGATVTRLHRRSKYLLADLDRGGAFLMHLGMSGRLLIEGTHLADFHRDPAILPKHDHVVLHTESGTIITFNDARRFGMVDLIRDGRPHPLLAQLGPEPFDAALDAHAFQQMLAGRRTAIKLALLDQRIIAGLGNIYVSESLHRSGIDPRRPAGALNLQEATTLLRQLRAVLSDAISAGGSSLRDHRQTNGELGYFQHSFQVYDRADQPCLKAGCQGTIQRFTQSGRSTYACPLCQH